MISDNARSGMQQAPARSLFNALGFTAEELKKPMVGIVSSYNEIVPGHMNIGPEQSHCKNLRFRP